MDMSAMAIINLNESESQLQELTMNRPLAALPFAGRYRLVDFTLSNLVNSGVTNVGILIRHKYRSLTDHLRSGKEWDLARKRDGLAWLPPAYTNYPGQMFRGDIENFHSNLDYIQHSREKYVIVTGSQVVCNMSFQPIIAHHQKSGADITVVYSDLTCSGGECADAVTVDVDDQGKVIGMKVHPNDGQRHQIGMGMYIMERRLLVKLVSDAVSRGDYDFVKHCIIKNLEHYHVGAYAYDGHVARIDSTQSYFQHNLELLRPEIWTELFSRSGLIYTKVKDEPPAKYADTAQVHNSLIANGCIIEGKVENSILFRGVRVQKGAHVKNCIITQRSIIGPDVRLEHVICDKNVQITAGRHLRGEENFPLVVKKGRVI